MKLVGGFVLWAIIFVIFTRWAHKEMAQDEQDRLNAQKAARAAGAAERAAKQQAADSQSAETIDLSTGAAVGESSTEAVGVLTFEEVSQEFADNPAPSEDS